MTVAEDIYRQAIDSGFTPEAAASLLAMIQAESAFRSDNAEDRIHVYGISDAEYIRRADSGALTFNNKNFIYDEVGFGYAQWTFWSRKKFFLEYCKGRGTSVADHETQKQFIFVEMKRDFPAIWDLCRTSKNLEEITKKLIWVWENPMDKVGAMAERFPYAQAWLAKFNGWSTPIEESPPQSVDDEGLTIEQTWPPRTIQNGLNWTEVYLLQALLRCHGYNVLSNGIFNDALEKIVREYQSSKGLRNDGIVGPKTWKSLMEVPSNF